MTTRPAAPRRPASARRRTGSGSATSRGTSSSRRTTTAKRKTASGKRGATARGASSRGSAHRGGNDGWGTGSRRTLVLGEGDSRRPIMSLRTLAFIVVCLIAVIIVTPTAYRAISQDEELRQVEAERVALETRRQSLEDDIARWDNEAFIQAQARDRLGYVMPGQTPYIVVNPEVVEGGMSEAERAEAEREEALAASRPWYGNLWESVEEAGTQEPEQAPAEHPEPATDEPDKVQGNL